MDDYIVLRAERVEEAFFGTEPDERSFVLQLGGEATPTFEQIIHVELRVSTDGEADPTGGMDGQIRDAAFVAFHGLVQDPSFGVPYTDGPILGSAEEIARIWGREAAMAEEGEAGDGARVLD
jgi:hypothetical protein